MFSLDPIHYSLRLAAAIISDHRKDSQTHTSYQEEPHQQDEHIGQLSLTYKLLVVNSREQNFIMH